VARVAVNLLWLAPGRVGGSEESTVASLRALAALAPTDLDLRLMATEPLVRAYPDLAEALPTDVLALSGRSRALRVAGEATWLAARTAGADLVHHAGGTAPPRSRRPFVLTLHDLQPLDPGGAGPRTHGRGKRAYLGVVVPRSLRRARLVVVPSEFVRATVLARSQLTPERVPVVPHAVAPHPAPTARAELAARYRLDGPVILYPAITYPHKNHATLVEAFGRVLADRPDALLVLTGRPDRAEADVRRAVEAAGAAARVRRLGRIPAEDVAGLYRLADVVAVPSRYEGFGLPAAEAMAHGAAVVAASGTALPEVVDEAGVVVDPDDVEGWAAAIGRLLSDDALRRSLGAAGRARAAARFSPEANGRALAGVYRAALR
jgi:glycosyltransferase involved in cell wall biosynthesis